MEKECWNCKHAGKDLFLVCFKCEKKDKWEAQYKRPSLMGKPLPIYEHEDSRIPDGIRVSFEDGTTAVYYLHTEQPAPLIFENIKIIRRMKQGYVNKPPRRRGRK